MNAGWGVVRMNSFDAARLPNKTYPWPGDPGYYIGELSVAHQLHCLVRGNTHPLYRH